MKPICKFCNFKQSVKRNVWWLRRKIKIKQTSVISVAHNRMHNNSDWQFIFVENQYQFIFLIKNRFFIRSDHCQFSFNLANTLIQNHSSTAPGVLYKVIIWGQGGEYPTRGMKSFFYKVVNFISNQAFEMGCSWAAVLNQLQETLVMQVKQYLTLTPVSMVLWTSV